MSRIFLQLVGAERFERDDLIETIDELGRELAPRGVRATAHDLSVELLVHGSVLGLPGAFARVETELGIDERAHLGGAQVAGHEDQRAGEIDFAVVAQGERTLVENAQQ